MKKFFAAVFLFILLAFPSAALKAADYGLNKAADQAGLPEGQGSTASQSLALEAGRITGVILSFLGVIFFILMIAGGIMWMTAGGADAKVATARKLITTAIIGLVIVLSAYAIATFVADNLVAK